MIHQGVVLNVIDNTRAHALIFCFHCSLCIQLCNEQCRLQIFSFISELFFLLSEMEIFTLI